MKKNTLITGVLLSFLIAFSVSAQQKEPSKTEQPKQKEQTAKQEPKQEIKYDPVLIKINNEEIKKSEVEDILKYFIKAAPKASKKGFNNLREQIEKSIIQRKVLSQAAKEKFKITDKEVKEFIKKELAKQNKTEEDLKQELAKQGLSMEKFIEKVKDDMYNYKLITDLRKKYQKEIKISDEEAKKYYTDHKKQFVIPETVEVRHILIKSKNEDENKKKELEKIREKIIKGESFEKLAKNFSDCGSRKNGGYLGRIKRGDTVLEFEEMAFNTKEGEISPVFKTVYGYHIVQVIKKYPSKLLKYEEVEKQIKQSLKQRKINEKIKAYFSDLNSKANIKIYEENQPQFEDLVPKEKRVEPKAKEKPKKDEKQTKEKETKKQKDAKQK